MFKCRSPPFSYVIWGLGRFFTLFYSHFKLCIVLYICWCIYIYIYLQTKQVLYVEENIWKGKLKI